MRNVFDRFFFIPDMVAGRYDLNTHGEQFKSGRLSDAEASGDIFAIGDDCIDLVTADDIGQERPGCNPSDPADNIADKKQLHALFCVVDKA